MLVLLLSMLILKIRRKHTAQRLLWQATPGIKGVGFRTKLLEITEEGCPLNGYKRFSIRAMLRVNGKIVCRKMYTMLKETEIPRIGDKVLIRYKPASPDHVLLNNLAV